MVLIRNNVQKESTYGWYPSKVNVYENPRANHGYDKECLFRHWESGLHHTNPTGVAPVTPPGFRGSMKSGSRSRNSKVSVPSSPAPVAVPQLLLKGSRPASFSRSHHAAPPQFVFEKSRPSSTGHSIPTPRRSKSYHGWQPQPTIIGIVDPEGPFIAPSPQLDFVAKEDSRRIETLPPHARANEMAVAVSNQLSIRPPTPAQKLSGSFRAQSASLNRPRVTPTRPVKSAGTRSRVTQATSTVSLEPYNNAQLAPNSYSHRSKSPCGAQLTHDIQVLEPEDDEELERPPTPVNLRSPTPGIPEDMTYEGQLDKYGWLAEVHGDPFNIKKLTERLPYAVRCEEPLVAENPYKTKVMVGETFFFNTIPRKPLTFTVHPEWQSEHFVAKRKELEKKGRKFHTRNYGFVY